MNLLHRLLPNKNRPQIQPVTIPSKYDTAYNRRWLLQCAVSGDYVTIQEMIEKGVSPNYQNREGKSALYIAVEESNFELVRVLMKSNKLTPNMIIKETHLSPLICACKSIRNANDRYKMVRLLLKIPGIDPNIQDKGGYTPMCYAASAGDLNIVMLLTDHKADINLGPIVEHKIQGPLHYARAGKKADIVKYLDSRGAMELSTPHSVMKAGPVPRVSRVHSKPPRPVNLPPITSVTPKHRTNQQVPKAPQQNAPIQPTIAEETPNQDEGKRRLLIEAIQKENISLVTRLILEGVDPNFIDDSSQTPLLIAIEKTNPELVKTLLKSPTINVNLVDEVTGSCPLIAASQSTGQERSNILKMLLNAPGIDINQQDKDGHTALIFACIFGDLEVAQLLISAGADVNLGNEGTDRIETPLYHAKSNEHETLVQLLELHGAEEGEPFKPGEVLLEENGETPATAVPRNVTVIPKITVTDTSQDTKFNRSMLLLKVKASETSAVRKLIEKGVDPNFVDDEDGKYALLVAIEKKNLEMIKLLLTSPKLNINLRDEETGETPLLFAAKQTGNNKLEVVKLLLQGEGLYINSQDNEGRTALFIGVELGDLDLCKTLLDCGADPKLPRKEESGHIETPIDAAKRCEQVQISSLLATYLSLRPEKPVVVEQPTTETEPDNKLDTAYNRSLMFLKSKQGDTKHVKTAIEQGVNPNFISDEGETALIASIEKKNLPMLKLLLSSPKIDLNLCDEDFGIPPIFVALKLPQSPERLEIIKLLLQAPGLSLSKTHEDISPLALATKQADAEVVKLLSEHQKKEPVRTVVGAGTRSYTADPKPITKTTLSPSPPRNRAFVKSKIPTPASTFTLTGSANSNLSTSPTATPDLGRATEPTARNEDTKWNRSLLLLHAKKGDNKEMKKLLDIGVSPNFLDEEGDSPLGVAISTANLSAVQMLLANEQIKIDVNLSDEMNGLTPLMSSAQTNGTKRLDIIKLLLQTPSININAQDEEGRTALVIATKLGDVEVAKLLIDSGADVNLGRSPKETPLQYAKLSNNKELLSLFVGKDTIQTPKPFEPARERFLSQSLTLLQKSSKRNLVVQQQQPQEPYKPFTDKVYVRVPIRDPVKDVIVGRGWKRFRYEENKERTALLCYDINTQLEEPELNISFDKVTGAEKRDTYNEPGKFAILIEPLKLLIAASTEKSRDIWMKIINHFIEESTIVPPKPQQALLPDQKTTELDTKKVLLQKVVSGDVKGVTSLLDNKTNVNFIYNGKTPLIQALEKGQVPIAKLLLSVGKADVNLPDEKGTLPINCAVKSPEKLQLVPLLLATPGININNPSGEDHQLPLSIAALNGDVEVARLLLEAKADVNMGKLNQQITENAVYFANKSTSIHKNAMFSLLSEYGAVLPAQQDNNEPSQKLRSDNQKPDPRQDQIMKDISEGNWQSLFELCIRQQFSVNFRDAQGRTPLTLAVENSDRNVVRVLLKSPILDINFTDKNNNTALIKSITGNKGPERNRIIIHLIQYEGILLNAKDKDSLTALVHAVIIGDSDAVKILVRAGANINLGKKTPERIETPLYLARIQNHEQISTFLKVSGGEEINLIERQSKMSATSSSEYNKKLFLLSVKNLDYVTIADLIKKGVDPNYIDRATGQTPLKIAIEKNNINLLRLLMKSPLLNINIRFDDVMCTPLIYAAKQKTGRLDMIRILLQPSETDKPVDINAKDRNGRSALTYAAFWGDYDLAKLLIDAKSDVNMKSSTPSKVESPLFYAKRNDHHKVVQLLLSHGAIDREISSPKLSDEVPAEKTYYTSSEPNLKNPKYKTSPAPKIKNTPTPRTPED